MLYIYIYIYIYTNENFLDLQTMDDFENGLQNT